MGHLLQIVRTKNQGGRGDLPPIHPAALKEVGGSTLFPSCAYGLSLGFSLPRAQCFAYLLRSLIVLNGTYS